MESMELGICSGPLGGRRRFKGDSVSRVLRTVSLPLKKVLTRTRTISKSAMLTVSRSHRGSLVAPIKTPSPKGRDGDWVGNDRSGDLCSSDLSLEDATSDSIESQNLQWAHGKAGEDRVHIVISEEHGWLFVGIYDGFNGPDAPDYLLSNLYNSIQKELKGLIWDREKANKEDDNLRQEERESAAKSHSCCNEEPEFRSGAAEPALPFDSEEALNYNIGDDKSHQMQGSDRESSHLDGFGFDGGSVPAEERDCDAQGEGDDKMACKRKPKPKQGKGRLKGMSRKWRESQRKWKHDWVQERLELDRRLKEEFKQEKDQDRQLDNCEVLTALSRALSKTEEAYLEMADKAVAENPELALMGSCVLVMLMMGEDVYVMNVGDSRAILAQKLKPDLGNPLSGSQGMGESIPCRDLERISEETSNDLEDFDDDSMDQPRKRPTLGAVQLSLDHSTSVEEEVQRIKAEHVDDMLSVTNDRVKGTLKVTRAFGAGFLKQPKWNDALLEMFRIDYVGSAPYITCTPALYHHRLGPEDHFLILSSDGLYQYFTNEEVVNHVEWFMSAVPGGDPAQHLVEEVLLRAAKKAGMDFHELLDIPQGDRRKYHDDVSVMVVSLEGRIWRSSAKEGYGDLQCK
uniref:TSA: Wollemia nobilis Ref_Wollemi_Transcript_8630_2293 transcribed RNA sequence n=1 Tax=Wollemia nobilis TaxID=56998 RepID=A0A0C9RWI0_9CONI